MRRRKLSRLVGTTTEIAVINSADYFLYLPLMPQAASGLVEPGHIRVSLPQRLRNITFVLGTVSHIDPAKKVVSWSARTAHPARSAMTAHPDRWQREQVAAHSGCRRLRARVPHYL
jgi:NADH dehydrogenase FAD-containing subunit